jgi:hypothetical protein
MPEQISTKSQEDSLGEFECEPWWWMDWQQSYNLPSIYKSIQPKFVQKGHETREKKHSPLLKEQFENNGSKVLRDVATQGVVRFGSLLNAAQEK